jgi:TPR repeat protein
MPMNLERDGRMFLFSSYAFRFTRCEACSSGECSSLSHCTRCLTVAFCNVDCQRASWPKHKLECRSRGAHTLAKLQARADNGDGAALADLGLIYFRGLCGQAANLDVAASTWARAAALGNEAGARLLAEFAPSTDVSATAPADAHAPPRLTLEEQDVKLSAAARAANAGHAACAIALYEACTTGPARILEARALWGLGTIYLMGQGLPEDEKRGAAYLRAAADAAVAAGVAGEPGANKVEAEMLSVLAQDEFFARHAESDGAATDADDAFALSMRASSVSRTLPLVERVWSLDPAEVSPFHCAVLAAGYAMGVGLPCDGDKAALWVDRAFTHPPKEGVADREAADARQSDALILLRGTSARLHNVSSPHRDRFNGAMAALHRRIAVAWAGSRTDSSATAAWWVAQQALHSARQGNAPFGPALKALKHAAAEGSGCAAHVLYTAYHTGTDGVVRSPAAAANWAARCSALGHSVGAGHHGDDSHGAH